MEVVPPITITAPESFNYNAAAVTVSASNVATAVTLSSVSIIYDTSGTEVELVAANYTYSNGVITLNFTSGSGRVTLDNLSDGVTISTTWSNGDVATDTSNVLSVRDPITVSTDSLIFDDSEEDRVVTVSNYVSGVTISSFTIIYNNHEAADKVVGSAYYTLAADGSTITIILITADIPNVHASNVTWRFVWSNGDVSDITGMSQDET